MQLFAKKGQTLKCELIREKAGAQVQCYTMGEFVDFCLGPHLPSTNQIRAFKLKPEPAAAYWKGREGNPSMQRIYGYAFFTKDELDQHLHRLEEAKRRDHRRLGRELDLFSISEESGGGLVLWHPRGALIRKTIEDFWRDQHQRNGYDFVYSPHVGRASLWETSGHLSFYRENMYSSMDVEGQEYFVKPMNCPFHIMIYKNKLRSYRDPNLVTDRFGPFMVRIGKVTQVQLDLVRAAADKTGRRTGDILVEMNLLKETEKLYYVAQQVKAIIYSLFAWEEGEYRLHFTDRAARQAIKVDLHPAHLITRGVKKLYKPQRLFRLLSPEDRLIPTPQPAYGLHEVELDRWEAELLPRADGTRTVSELVALARRPEHVVYGFLFGMAL